VWVSLDNGASWECAIETAPFRARYAASAFWRNGVLFIMGGVAINPSTGSTTTLTDMFVAPNRL
jgi:hypothetical protein